jgi:hypothetical protein
LRVAAVILAAMLALAGCGDDDTTTAEEIKASTTTSSLFVDDGQPDSCGVFTREEVKALVDNEVAPGTDTGAGQGCYFAGENEGTALLVNLQPGDSAAKFADSRSNAGEQTSRIQPIEGVADEAFVYAPEAGGLASAEARKGSIRVRVVVTGSDATVEMAKNALVAAVPRVPSN